MSKRNVTFIKPQDPKFLQQLKQQIGYKEGPSVETKKQKLLDLEAEDIERDDEKPQIVVVHSGDLTAEEVAIEEIRSAKEAAEAPADLSKPIVFRKRHKPADNIPLETGSHSKKKLKNAEIINKKHTKSSETSSIKSTSKLSFNVEEEEED